jgi:hypothetical protein
MGARLGILTGHDRHVDGRGRPDLREHLLVESRLLPGHRRSGGQDRDARTAAPGLAHEALEHLAAIHLVLGPPHGEDGAVRQEN